MMKFGELCDALEKLRVETGSLACLGCGHEHNCSIHGCAILRQVEMILMLSPVMQCRNCDFWSENDPRCMSGKSPYGGRATRPEERCNYCCIDLLAASEEARADLGKWLAKAEQELTATLAGGMHE